MITVENLTKKFGDITAAEDLNFQVDEGEVFGFLGPNGAGKTTTIRILGCLVSSTANYR
jgi:ABC-2 type transport system ATP-binding protein